MPGIGRFNHGVSQVAQSIDGNGPNTQVVLDDHDHLIRLAGQLPNSPSRWHEARKPRLPDSPFVIGINQERRNFGVAGCRL